MANDKMMAQMSSKDGFIAALDQSGGSTPGALRLYGIADSEYSGEAEMFRLMHEMRVRIMTVAGLHRREGHRRDPVRAHDGRTGEGQAGADVPVGGAGRRSVPEGRQGARGGKRRRQPDEADAGSRRRCSPGRRSSASTAPRCAPSSTWPRRPASPPSRSSSSRSANRSPAHGLMPILEPEVSIKSPDKAGAEAILLAELTKGLDALPAGRQVMLKLTHSRDAGFLCAADQATSASPASSRFPAATRGPRRASVSPPITA